MTSRMVITTRMPLPFPLTCYCKTRADVLPGVRVDFRAPNQPYTNRRKRGVLTHWSVKIPELLGGTETTCEAPASTERRSSNDARPPDDTAFFCCRSDNVVVAKPRRAAGRLQRKKRGVRDLNPLPMLDRRRASPITPRILRHLMRSHPVRP